MFTKRRGPQMAFTLRTTCKACVRLMPVLALFALGACEERVVAPAEVPGVYVLASTIYGDTLELRSGGTYVRRYHGRGIEATDQGRWRLISTTNPARLSVDGFVDRVTAANFNISAMRGTWLPIISHSSENVRILLNKDEELFYEKQIPLR